MKARSKAVPKRPHLCIQGPLAGFVLFLTGFNTLPIQCKGQRGEYKLVRTELLWHPDNGKI